MLNYKVEFDEASKQIIVHFYNEDGEEVQPENGTYKITVPANTFMWYGDGVGCDGKNGNDEFVYIYRVADKAPAPIIKAYIENGIIYYVVENSSSPSTQIELGYTTQSTDADEVVKFSPYAELDNIQWVPNGDVRRFGYTEDKSYYYVNLKDDFGFIPDAEYVATLLAGTVVNVGDGVKYEASHVPNENTEAKFLTPPAPSASVRTVQYDSKSQTLTALVDLSSVYKEDGLWSSDLNTLKLPVVRNDAGTSSVAAAAVTWTDTEMQLTFNIKNPDEFIKVNPDSSKYLKFTVEVTEGYIINEGNGSEFIGITKNAMASGTGTSRVLKSVSKPTVVRETRSAKKLTLDWNNVYEKQAITTKEGSAKFTAVFKDGSTADISSYVSIAYPSESSKQMVAQYNTEDNFGLDPQTVERFELTLPEGMLKNVGDEEFTSGSAKSDFRVYSYSPVDCQPVMDINNINMVPFYPVVTGEKIAPLHDAEMTTVNAGAITVCDTEGTVLMTLGANALEEIEDASVYGESGVTEDISSTKMTKYGAKDIGKFSTSSMYRKDGAYERYYGNKIVLNVHPEKVVTQGDGYTCLGSLSGRTNTPAQTKYVLEFSIPNNNPDFLGKIITGNTLGGPIDWNEEYITACMMEGMRASKPYFMGCYGWSSDYSPQDVPYFVSNNIYYTKNTSVGKIGFDSIFSAEYSSYYYAYAVVLYSGDETLTDDEKTSIINNVTGHCQWNGGFKAYTDWLEDYFDRHPFTVVKPDYEATMGKYSGYWFDMTETEQKAMVQDFVNFYISKAVNNRFNLYYFKQNNDDTYSFLYDKPASHWAFGSQGRLYNNGTINQNTSQILFIKEMKKIDVSNQSDFSWMFANQSSLTKVSAKFDMRSASAMTGMFFLCNDLKAEIQHEVFEGEINTGDKLNEVLYADYAFEGCRAITALPDTFQFANLYDATNMFSECNSLMKLPASFNPTNIEIADGMFRASNNYPSFYYDDNHNFKCYGYGIYDETDKKGCDEKWKGEHPDHEYTYLHHTSEFVMTAFPETWTSVSKIKTANHMFDSRNKIVSMPQFWNFSSLESGESMFISCSSLGTIPTAWTSTDNLVNANTMFDGCSSITKMHNGFKCKNLETANYMFSRCTSLSALNEDFQPLNLISSMGMFSWDENLTKIPSSWTTIETIESASSMFLYSGIKELPATWTVCNATEAEGMFSNTPLQKIKMNFTSLEHFTTIFGDTDKLKEVDGIINIENWKVDDDPNIWNGSSRCTKFKIEGLGKISNQYSSSTTEKKPVFYMYNSEDYQSWTDEEINDWIDSVFYMLDHAWTGTTEKNMSSHYSKRNTTYSRNMNGHYIYIRINLDFIDNQRDRIQSKLATEEHEQVTKDVFSAWFKGGDDEKTGWSYRISTSVWR